jgi:hypothetical protein
MQSQYFRREGVRVEPRLNLRPSYQNDERTVRDLVDLNRPGPRNP